MKFPIPRRKVADAFLDGGSRPEADIAHQVVDIGSCLTHVPGLHRLQVDLCLAAQFLLQKPDDIGDFDGRVVADIVDAPWRNAALCRIRFRVRRRIRLRRRLADQALDRLTTSST